jgi:hypothetical protein
MKYFKVASARGERGRKTRVRRGENPMSVKNISRRTVKY